MIQNTPVKTNYTASSETSSGSDLSFQFDFEDTHFFFAPEEPNPGFLQKIKEKWLDYKGELRLVGTAYCLIFTLIAFLGANALDRAAPTINNADLSIAPITTFSKLYDHFNQNVVSAKLEKPMFASAVVQKETSTSADAQGKEEAIAVLSKKTAENAIPMVTSEAVEPSIDLGKEATSASGTAETAKPKEKASNLASKKNGIQVISKEYQKLIEQISGEGKHALLKFGAKWCVPCQIMEETVFQDEQVNQQLKQSFKSMTVDVDHFDGYNLKQYYAVDQIPTFVILNAEGEEIGRYSRSMTTVEMRTVLSAYQNSL